MNRSLAPLALTLFALVLPATAGAATRCVPANAPGCDASHATIGEAVTAAVSGDTIRIAAGTYDEAITTDKRLNFLGAGGGTIEAAPAGTTTIAPISGTALTLNGGGSVRALRAVGATSIIGSAGISLSPIPAGAYGYELTDVVVIGGTGTDIMFGFGAAGLSANSTGVDRVIGLTVSGSQFRAGGSAGFAIIAGAGVTLNGAGLTTTISRSRLTGGNVGTSKGLAATGTKATIEDSTVTGGYAASLGDGEYVVRRSRFHGTPENAGNGYGLVAEDMVNGQPLKLTIEDSLLIGEPGAGAEVLEGQALSVNATGGADVPVVDVNGSTLIARGADPDAAAATRIYSGSPTDAKLTLRNSVALLEGEAETGEADLFAQIGTITALNSSFTKVATVGTGTTTAPGSGSNIAGNPQLAADLAPAAGSRLIDRGDPAFAYPGELDVNATPRSQDGTGDCVAIPDIGAFELPSRCPAKPANVAPKVSKASLSRKRFTARKPVHEGRKRGSKLSFTLSEAARVTVAVERKTDGRRVKVRGKRRCVEPTRANAAKPRCTRYAAAGKLRKAGKAGPNTVKLTGKLGGKMLKPGRYRLTLTAVDAAGLRSKPLRIGFAILRP